MMRSSLALAAGVLLAGAVGVRLLSGAPEGSRSLMGQLMRARPDRAFAARLSIPTNYQLCTPAPDSTTSSEAPVPREACAQAADAPVDLEAFAAALASVDPDSLHASALANVIWWDRSEPSLDAVILLLEKARRLSRRPVPLLVDLSAAHLVRAEQTQNSRDLVRALDAAREALASEPRNPAALFNSALALQAFAVDGEAAKEWDRYLAVDSMSPWANEARRRKRALRSYPTLPGRPMAGASADQVQAYAKGAPQEARELGWNTVLGEWGRAITKGDSRGAAAQLALAEALGAALEARGGDASLADAVRAIHDAQRDARATAVLAWAHRTYADAHALYASSRYPEARSGFERIVRARPPSPTLVQWSQAFFAGTLVYAEKVERAERDFRALLARVDGKRHPAIEARVRWMYGTLLLRHPRHEEARSQYRTADSIFERLGEVESLGRVLANEGETAFAQGDTLPAYQYMHRAMRALRPYRGSMGLHNQLLVLAERVVEDGMPWAVPPMYDEDVAVTTRAGTPFMKLEALLARAHVRAVLGEHAGAERDLAALGRLLPALRDEEARDWTSARLHFTRAVVKSGNPPPHAMMDSAVEYFTSAANASWVVPALLRRAEMRMAAGDVAGAAGDLEAATEHIHGVSSDERNAMLRSAAMEQARKQFDQLVMLHVRAGRSAEALRVLENGRTSFASAPRRLEPLRATDGEVAVEYALIGDTLLVWTVRSDSVHLVVAALDRDDFLLTVEEVGAALESSAGEGAVPGLQRLYDWLVRPVRDRLGEPGTPLVILADGEISRVPFAALQDSARKSSGAAAAGGRYLVEDRRLRFAATLSDARRTLRRADAPLGRALLVADPAFDRTLHPTLDNLRGAREEVDSLRKIYPRHVFLDGPRATRSAVAAAARSVHVIHYAGHAVFNDARPERSKLVLAGGDTTGQLTAEAVHRMRLPNVRLVVLSACGTLRSRDGRSGGFAGFSGALLAAGAGGVVGSLWDVDDGSTQHLMRAFHTEYLHRGNAAAALRQAQLHMLRSSDPALRSPATWAGFRYSGR
jgi:CHAT domain-containing protein